MSQNPQTCNSPSPSSHTPPHSSRRVSVLNIDAQIRTKESRFSITPPISQLMARRPTMKRDSFMPDTQGFRDGARNSILYDLDPISLIRRSHTPQPSTRISLSAHVEAEEKRRSYVSRLGGLGTEGLRSSKGSNLSMNNIGKVVNLDLEQANIFIHALQGLEGREPPIIIIQPELSIIKPALIHYPKQTVDYSALFPNSFELGVTIFRIEDMRPIILDFDTSEPVAIQFCCVDCYIILDYHEDNDAKSVFTWIGSDSETDKKYAVALRELLGLSKSIQREVMEDESPEFINLMGEIEIVGAEHGTITSLFTAVLTQPKPRIYLISDGKQMIRLVNVLTSGKVFVIDDGTTATIWQGKASSLKSRARARIVANRIRRNVIDVEEGENLNEVLEEEKGVDRLELYQAGTVLEANLVTTGKITRNMLKSDQCYVIDADTQLFFWIGKNCKSRDSSELLLLVLNSRARVSWIDVNQFVEGAESEIFKLLFYSWSKPVNLLPVAVKRFVDVDVLCKPVEMILNERDIVVETMEVANEMLESFTTFVFSGGKFINLPEREKGIFFQKDAYLFLCIYRATPGQSQLILETNSSSSIVPDLIEADDCEAGLVCVVYFCQTRRTSRIPYSTFQLSTLKEMQELVKSMYGCEVRVELVEWGMEPFFLLAHLENSFVLNLGGRSEHLMDEKKCYHIRCDLRYYTTRLIQFIPFVLISRDCFLFSDEGGDVILWMGKDVDPSGMAGVVDGVNEILRFEKGESDDKEDIPEREDDSEARLLPDYVLLTSEIDHPALDQYFGLKLKNLISISNSPIFFLCTTASGFFRVLHLTHFSQRSLVSDSCSIIYDGEQIVLWVGNDCTPVFRSMVDKCVLIWHQTCLKGISSASQFDWDSMTAISNDDIIYVKEGKEPDSFKAYFHGWSEDIQRVINPGNQYLRQQRRKQ